MGTNDTGLASEGTSNSNDEQKRQTASSKDDTYFHYPCGAKIKALFCHKCSFKTKYKAQLQKHKQKVHWKAKRKPAGTKRIKASSPKTCYKSIKWFQLRPFSCSLCKFRCTSIYTLRHHQARHEMKGKTDHQCTLCSYSAGSSNHLIIHMNLGHYLDILPKDPPAACPDPHQHVQPVQEGKKKLLRSSSSLVEFRGIDPHNEPRSKVWRNKPRTFSCPLCGFRSARESNLKMHQEQHSKRSAFACCLCSYSATSLSYLNLHLSRDHPDVESPSTNKSTMDVDEDESKEEEPRPSGNTEEVPVYHCPVCPWWKRYISNFHAHMLTHSSSPAYKCSNCAYTAKGRGSVSDHIRQEKEANNGTHSSARVVSLQPVPNHRYAAYLRPAVVPKGVYSGRSLLPSGGGDDTREETGALRERVEVMEGKVREALEEAERISARREKLRMRGGLDRKFLEKEDEELAMELQLAEWSRIGAEEVLRILQEELKSLVLTTVPAS